MNKRLVVIGLTILLAALIGCAKKADETEVENAEILTNGILSMMINVDAYSRYSGSSPQPGVLGLPGWYGPAVFHVPEGAETLYYYIKIPFSDTLGQDTLLTLIMLSPDIGDTLIPDTSFVTKIDLWLWRVIQNNIWWHFTLEMSPDDTLHISGSMKWHYRDTWLSYVFTNMGVDTTDESGIIDVTTSDDIKLSAHFAFITDGSGTGWGKYQDYEFVRFVFFAEPTAEGYKGYYTLASEGWKVEHYFPKSGA